MNSAYSTAERDGKTIDILSDPATGLKCEFLRTGAEMVSLQLRDQPFLYRDGDVRQAESGWNNHATVMGYYLHRILDGKSLYRGHPIEGNTHSFLRNTEFGAPEVTGDSLTYKLAAGDYLKSDYPLLVGFAITYRLTPDGRVEVTFEFQNEEEIEAHVSFGLHPGFAVTSWESMELLLPAGQYRRHMAPGNFLTGETQDIEIPAASFPFEKADLPGSYLLEFVANTHRIVTLLDAECGHRIEVDFADCPFITIWSDGGPFVCIEPCWGLPDHHAQRVFERKLGIQTIPAQSSLARSFTIQPMSL